MKGLISFALRLLSESFSGGTLSLTDDVMAQMKDKHPSEFALTQPQACSEAYTFGLKYRWTYFLRTLPDIQDLLQPLENAIYECSTPL